MDPGKVVHRRKPNLPVIRPRASDEKQQVNSYCLSFEDLHAHYTAEVSPIYLIALIIPECKQEVNDWNNLDVGYVL